MTRISRAGLRRASLASVVLLFLQVLAVVLAPAALAAAPNVTSCSPSTGPVGTSVTITGTDFSAVDRVEFNGTDATFTINSATQITTTVPSGATDGPVAVTDLGTGGGTDTCPSAFDVTVTTTPTISGFTPTSGPVGTSVVITGTNFTGTTVVKFNNTNSTFTVNSATQITATVPSGATDGTIKVTNSAGTGTSAASFDVTPPPAPTITSFSPTSGAPGTSVVITGTTFTGATSVKFAGTTATFTVNNAGQITATVPAAAATGAISVTTPQGTATSSSSFTVTPAGPVISSFTPTSGASGTSVTINGSNLTGATAVRFNGVNATFTVASSIRINTTVPAGASTGRITVVTPNGTGTSATDFTVPPGAPSITSFTPANGPVGSSVVLTGTSFTGTVTVKFNATNASFTVNSTTQITATVPNSATTGKITATNGVGTGTSATDFVVTKPPTITSFSPGTGSIGSTVTINGTNFTGTSAVRFNGVTATFTVNTDIKITTTVPSGATTGRITVVSSAGTATSTTDFVVGPLPSVTSFTPSFGPVGTQVTITGSNFTGATAVRFGGVAATFTVDSATQITTTVPTGAIDGKITVSNINGTATSSSDFIVQERHSRFVSLSLSGHLRASGTVDTADAFTACEANVVVKIQRQGKRGRWRIFKTVGTDATGLFSTGLPDSEGAYRARVVRTVTTQDVCERATSPQRAHRH